MIRRPPRSTQSRSSAASDVYKRQVVVHMDDGPWEQAELREPLSGLTWVIWRYSWPFQPGQHTLYVRCRDGEGNWQVAESSDTYPDGATGLHAFRIPADYVFPEG